MLSVIIPTYNESESIVHTITEVSKALQGIFFEIIVVDDNSPDGTAKVVRNVRKKNVRVVVRKHKTNLSDAVLEGFSKARYNTLVVMDADGQHDPRILKTMFEKSEQYDFVIGSRFVKGGSVESWSKHRIFFSKSAALLARPVLKSNLKDPMSGFFMLKKETFRAVKPYVLSRGYKILLDMLVSHTIHIQKPSFLEIPYSFRPRFLGTSKVSSKVIIEYMHMLLIFAFLRYKKLFLFLSVGAFGFLLNTTVLWSLTEIVGLFYVISGIIATILAIISNFMLNNCLTWSKIAKRHSFMKRFVLFFIISLGGLVISVSTLWFLTELGLYYLVSNAVGIIVATAWNYIINDRVTFS